MFVILRFIVGCNGVGKTTLLSLVASYRPPTQGMVFIDGEEAFENEDKMGQVIFIYPGDYTEETESVSDYVDWIKSYQKEFNSDYVDYLMTRFKIPTDQAVNKLSKGMQSSLQAAIGLASRAPITIFDEAYLSMDAPSREIFYEELLADQERFPRLIIISTHLVSEAEYLFDEVIIMREGKILMHNAYDNLISQGGVVTGLAEEVDEFVTDFNPLNEKRLGIVKAVTVFGESLDKLRKEAQNSHPSLEISSVSLQTLFTQLTEEE